MIHLREHPLSDTDIQNLHEWLKQPACRVFMDYLARKAAEHAARAGVLACSGDEVDEPETKDEAEQARLYDGLKGILAEAQDPEFHFPVFELLPKPLTT